MAITMTSYEISINDAYFIAHPEKVAGVETMRSGPYGPEKEIKGTKEDVLTMFAFLEKRNWTKSVQKEEEPESEKIKATATARALALALELEMDLED